MIEVSYNLEEIVSTIQIEDIKIGKRYQFNGDINRVREVIDIYEEFITIQTLGCTEDTEYYTVHYSQLKINETSLEELK